MKFPYMKYEDIGEPVIPIEIKGEKWHEVWGLVDTGATYTTLHSEEADRLGINYVKFLCKQSLSIGSAILYFPYPVFSINPTCCR